MRTWKCPDCGAVVPAAVFVCTCGHERQPLSVGSEIVDPSSVYPWLTRSITLFRVFAYLTLLYGVVKAANGIVTYLALESSETSMGSVAALIFELIGIGIATALAVSIQFALSDAASALLGVHRRLNTL
jgi:hypothetical protein